MLGRGFKHLEDHLDHQKQKDGLLISHGKYTVREAKYTKFAAFVGGHGDPLNAR